MLTLDGSWKDLGNANMSGWINVDQADGFI